MISISKDTWSRLKALLYKANNRIIELENENELLRSSLDTQRKINRDLIRKKF